MINLLCAHGQPVTALLDMTYGECAGIAAAIERKVKAEQEQVAMMAWKTAEMVGQYIAVMFIKGAPKPQKLYQAFPWIERPEPSWEELKARMTSIAAKHNTSLAEKR